MMMRLPNLVALENAGSTISFTRLIVSLASEADWWLGPCFGPDIESLASTVTATWALMPNAQDWMICSRRAVTFCMDLPLERLMFVKRDST